MRIPVHSTAEVLPALFLIQKNNRRDVKELREFADMGLTEFPFAAQNQGRDGVRAEDRG